MPNALQGYAALIFASYNRSGIINNSSILHSQFSQSSRNTKYWITLSYTFYFHTRIYLIIKPI